MEAKAFLVTGASGFPRYHMCKYLVTRHQTVRGMDIEAFDYTDIANEVTFFKGDIRLSRTAIDCQSNSSK